MKKIYPSNFIYIIILCIYFLVVLISIYVIIMSFDILIRLKNYIFLLPLIISLFSMTLFFYAIIGCFSYKIIFYEDKIIIKGEKIKSPIQFDDYIFFSEISDIKIISAHINSNGKYIKKNSIYAKQPSVFFLIILKNSKRKFIFIAPYSIKQRKKILKIINDKTKLNFVYDELIRVGRSFLNNNK